MPIRPIISYPNTLLRTPALPVTEFGPALHGLVTDLLDTMRAAPGIGITGPHIGVLQRVVVLELSPKPGATHLHQSPACLGLSRNRPPPRGQHFDARH